MKSNLKTSDGPLNNPSKPSAVLQFFEVFAYIIIPKEFFFGGIAVGMSTARKTQVVPVGKVVSLNKERGANIVFYFLYFIVLTCFCLLGWLFFFEGQKHHPFYFVNGVAFNPTDPFADFDDEEVVFGENGEYAHETGAYDSLFGVRGEVLIGVWVERGVPSWMMFLVCRSILICEVIPVVF